jgi:hypothetical protein
VRNKVPFIVLCGSLALSSCGQRPPVTQPETGARPMKPFTLAVRHVSVSINRPPRDVYRFAANVDNLPKWATGLVGSGTVRNVNGEWIVSGGPIGRVTVRFTPQNDLGVLDHDVVLDSGVTVHNPIRVVPNGAGSELTFSVFRQPDVSDEQFERDTQAVQKDLEILKRLLEQ